MKLFHYLNIKQIFWIIFLVIAAKIDLFGQQTFVDDPNLDQVPEWYLEQIQKSPKQIAQVITINDYDNFFLGVDNAEGHISVNPLNPTQFFTVFNTDNAHYSMDGFVWENTQPNWGVTIRGDVVSAYDSLGNLFYENMYGSSILGCKVVRSTNNGQTWSSPVTAISGNDKNWIAADQTSGPYANYVYTTMTNNGVGNFARSTDHGATWTSTFQPTTQSLPGMMVCVGPYQNIQGGAVYVVTNSGDAFASTYTFYRSLNGGATFQQMSSQNFAGYVGTNLNGRHSVENMRTRPYPFIAADNSYGAYRGRLYLVYAANFPAGNGNKPDIWCRYSANGGTTWSSAIRVNDDGNPELHHQFEPAIWCDKNTGRLYIQWMDTRDTPANDKALIYATYSDNGGQSFAANKAISNEKMTINCTTCGGSGTPRYQGDYNGIVSNSKVSMATWADFRYGTFASFTSFFPDYAMRVTPLSQQISSSGTFYAEVPDVKLYSDAVIFTATVSNPPSGSFTISYPNGNSLSSFPGSVPVVVTANNVPAASYTLTISGKGINGTPVHYREATINVIAAQPPVANFSASTTNPFIGQTVNFTDLSTNNPTSWTWSFSPSTIAYVGGTTSSSQNPQVQFLSGGFYTVILTVTNSGGSDGETKTNYISVLFAPIANFSANNTNPFIGQTVSFTDLSVNNPVSWTWSFNPATINYIGGTSASSQNPQVQFTAGGFYTVSLIASNPSGSDSEIKMNYISTIFAPIADFDADNYSPSITQTVNFWDLSLYNPTSWSWSFDPNTISYVGGTNSFSRNPRYNF